MSTNCISIHFIHLIRIRGQETAQTDCEASSGSQNQQNQSSTGGEITPDREIQTASSAATAVGTPETKNENIVSSNGIPRASLLQYGKYEAPVFRFRPGASRGLLNLVRLLSSARIPECIARRTLFKEEKRQYNEKWLIFWFIPF
jgi:hypothetical protein